MNNETRLLMREQLMVIAQRHNRESQRLIALGEFPESIMESGKASGILEAIEFVAEFGRLPANSNNNPTN